MPSWQTPGSTDALAVAAGMAMKPRGIASAVPPSTAAIFMRILDIVFLLPVPGAPVARTSSGYQGARTVCEEVRGGRAGGLVGMHRGGAQSAHNTSISHQTTLPSGSSV